MLNSETEASSLAFGRVMDRLAKILVRKTNGQAGNGTYKCGCTNNKMSLPEPTFIHKTGFL